MTSKNRRIRTTETLVNSKIPMMTSRASTRMCSNNLKNCRKNSRTWRSRKMVPISSVAATDSSWRSWRGRNSLRSCRPVKQTSSISRTTTYGWQKKMRHSNLISTKWPKNSDSTKLKLTHKVENLQILVTTIPKEMKNKIPTIMLQVTLKVLFKIKRVLVLGKKWD